MSEDEQFHQSERAHADREVMIGEIVSAKKAILGVVVTGMSAGVVMLVMNHFTLREAVAHIGELQLQIRETNERVSEMWFQGGWAGAKPAMP